MPYEVFDKAESIVNIFLNHPNCSEWMIQDRKILKWAVQKVLKYRPKWIVDCDCAEQGIICDCEQLSQR